MLEVAALTEVAASGQDEEFWRRQTIREAFNLGQDDP